MRIFEFSLSFLIGLALAATVLCVLSVKRKGLFILAVNSLVGLTTALLMSAFNGIVFDAFGAFVTGAFGVLGLPIILFSPF